MSTALIVGLAILVIVLIVALSNARAQASDASLEADKQRASDRAQIAALEAERAALRAIVNGVGEGLIAVDRQRRVVLANRRFSEMFGLEDDIAGRPVLQVIRVQTVISLLDVALGGSEGSDRFSFDGDRRIEMRAFPVGWSDVAAVALFIDVTRVEALEQIRRDFIADFSHEARTPLTGLRSAVETYEVAAEKLTGDDDRQLRRIIMRQLARLERLVEDLAELSRIESGDLTLTRKRVEIRSLIEDVCEDFHDRAHQERLQFAITGDNPLVHVDPVRMQQAFSNLIDNALKYGGHDTTIDVDVRTEGRLAVVRITDHGEGLSPAESERIFNRFYRVDKSRSQDVTGTGLGLAITKHLVLLHGGTIDVDSEPGEGATFIVRLPLYVE